MDDKNLYASPEAEVDIQNDELLAGRFARLVGSIIDGVLTATVVLPAMFYFGYFDRAMANNASLAEQATWPLLGFATYLALNAYLLATSGQTIGKRVVGVRIVSVEDGKILPLSRLIMLRVLPFSILGQVPLLGPIAGLVNVLFIFGPARRCLHDYLAGTRVILA